MVITPTPAAANHDPVVLPSTAAGGDAGHRTLVEHFAVQVRERRNHPALFYRAGDHFDAITWGQFGADSRCLSAYLLTQNVAEQSHVAIWANNRPEWHIADMAILAVRARPVPVYLTLSSDQGGYVLGHSESRVAIVENTTILERVLGVRSMLPSLVRVIVMAGLDRPSEDGFVVPWTGALEAGAAALQEADAAAEVDRRAAAVAFDDVATLIYTSGTTGPPKAVTLTHANIAAVASALREFVAGDPDERVLSYLPLAHVAERLVSEFRSYMYGNPTYFLDGLPHLGQRLREVRPTQFFAVPRVWEKMAQTVKNEIAETSGLKRRIALWALGAGERACRVEQGGRRVGRVLAWKVAVADRLVFHKLRAAMGLDQARIMACGAAPISAEVLLFFKSVGLEICEVYGQTEDTAVATMNRPGAVRIGTVGIPISGVDIKVAPDGEILVKGASVFSGYYKDPAATAEALIDGWLHTGDVGEFDADGYLRITDRKKDLIITAGGKNIAPSNIENALTQHSLIANAVAIGDRRPYVTALLTLDPDEAARFARRRGIDPALATVRASAELEAEVGAHVQAVNRELSHVEQVKKWRLLDHEFVVGDELTPTLKVKRKVVAEKYATEIDSLYSR